MKRWKKIFHANGNEKKAGVAILISDKIAFKTKPVTRDKEGYNIMVKRNITRGYKNCKYLCTKIGASKYIMQILTDIKGEIDNNTIIVGTSTHHSHQWFNHPDRKSISRGSWVAQLVKHPILDFSSDHDLMFVRLSPLWGFMMVTEPA